MSSYEVSNAPFEDVTNVSVNSLRHSILAAMSQTQPENFPPGLPMIAKTRDAIDCDDMLAMVEHCEAFPDKVRRGLHSLFEALRNVSDKTCDCRSIAIYGMGVNMVHVTSRAETGEGMLFIDASRFWQQVRLTTESSRLPIEIFVWFFFAAVITTITNIVSDLYK